MGSCMSASKKSTVTTAQQRTEPEAKFANGNSDEDSLNISEQIRNLSPNKNKKDKKSKCE